MADELMLPDMGLTNLLFWAVVGWGGVCEEIQMECDGGLKIF